MPLADPRPGFQGSETSSVEVTIYQHGKDPVLLSSLGGKFTLTGKGAADQSHSVISVSTSKSLRAPSGTFSITLKPSRVAEEIFQWITDDDWVDIVYWRHKRPFHVMRGLVDGIQRSRAATGSGATQRSYVISGRDFARIWEMTPVWFSPYANNDLVSDAIAYKIFQALPQVVGAPPTAVKAYLSGFLESLRGSAGIAWEPPTGMPGIVEGSFLKSVTFVPDATREGTTEVFKPSNLYQNIPPRIAFNPNYMMPAGTLWQLASENSDPLFTEFYADLFPDGNPLAVSIQNGDPVEAGKAKMTVVIRDKPFPTAEYPSLWKQIPMSQVPRQQIVGDDIGKGGGERFNTFYIASYLFQEALSADALRILAPLVNLEELKIHGMRRMDVQSSMAPKLVEEGAFSSMSETQRRICRDWYCLNPYLLSGTINLGIGRPDIKIGCRIQIPNDGHGQKLDETYYVEQVSHTWEFGRGMRTQLGVTRGWQGDDNSYQEKLDEISSAYSVPEIVKPE